MEEIMTTTNEEIMENEVTELTEYDVPEEESGSGLGTIGKLVIVAGVGALVGLGIKNKQKIADWRNEKRAKKLEKAGYIVMQPTVEDDFDEDFDSEVEDDNNSVETQAEEK